MHRLPRLLLLACVFAVASAAGFAHSWIKAPTRMPAPALSPVCVLAFDGRAGTMIVDAAAIARLEAGNVIRTRYGANTIALRIERKERRRDHLYVAMVGVDHVDGDAIRTSGAFHLHDDGTVTHFLKHAKLAFDVHGRANARLPFASRRRATHAP